MHPQEIARGIEMIEKLEARRKVVEEVDGEFNEIYAFDIAKLNKRYDEITRGRERLKLLLITV